MKLVRSLHPLIDAAEESVVASIAAGLHVPERIVLPLSWAGHIPFASWVVMALEPAIVVELGVHTGNSFFTFAESAAHHHLPTKLYGIDTWAGDEHAGAYAEDVYLEVNAIAKSRFPDSVTLIRKLFEVAVEDFEDGSIDLLHIDGLHTYEAVRLDFDTWKSKLSKRAIVLFHDTNVVREDFGVWKFWQEVSAEYPSFAFSHSNGLGVLLVGPDVPAAVASLLRSDSTLIAFTSLFKKLGEFLLRALKNGPDVDALPINPSLDPPRIYLAADGFFNESNAIEARPLPGSPTTLHCRFPPIADYANLALRIDPLSRMGIRGIHRVLLFSESSRTPLELIPQIRDGRERLTIIPVDGGFLFVATGEDSQWIPHLDTTALELFKDGATLTFEPMAVAPSRLSRLLLESVRTLIAPLEERIERLAENEPRIEQLQTELASAEARNAERADVLRQAEERHAGEAAGWADQRSALEHSLHEAEQRLAASEAMQAELHIAFRAAEERHGSDCDALTQSLHHAEQRLLDYDRKLTDLARAGRHPQADSAESLQPIHLLQQKLAVDDEPGIARISTVFSEIWSANGLWQGRHLVERRRQSMVAADDAHSLSIGRPLHGARSDSQVFLLEPLSGVVPLDDSGIRWQAVTHDPQFGFAELSRFAGEWVELVADLKVAEATCGSPVIYLDVGRGMSEANVISLPRPNRETSRIEFIFPVPPELKGARFDPCSVAAEFSLGSVQVRRLSKWQAFRGMARVMRGAGRLEQLKDEYLPQWRSMRSAEARRFLKGAFVHAYGLSVQTRASTYAEWINLFEVAASAYAILEAKRSLWDHQPLISVIMPTYNTPAKYLRDAIESVREQHYPNWELCIADDASTASHVRKVLQEYVSRDKRIKVVARKSNGHISEASNSALEIASGEFIALLDHDDRLHPLALHYVAEAIVNNPAVQMIYSDEDKIEPSGARSGPYFKCDFNYELFLAQNMISHLGCFRTELVRRIGGFRIGFEGSQDWDLALRAVEQIQPKEIIHIPRVLYHWREIPGSTAVSTDQKPYAQLAGRRAVVEHLKRRGVDAVVTPAPNMPGWNRVRHVLPAVLPGVSIIIPTRNRIDVLKKCIESLLERTTYRNYEIIIVDNGSTEESTLEFLNSLHSAKVRVLRDDTPFNYSRLNNRAVESVKGEYVCLMNNDIEVITADWLEEMVSMAIQPTVGIVGARLWYPDGQLQHGGVILGIGGIAAHSHRPLPKDSVGYFGRAALHQQLSAVTGACLLIHRFLWDELGGLDENLAVAFNDIDLCLRASSLGYRTIWTPYAELIHHESLSRGADNTPEKIARFESEQAFMRARWGDSLQRDPFYSPNLTFTSEDFSLSWDVRLP